MDDIVCDYGCRTVGESITKYNIPDGGVLNLKHMMVSVPLFVCSSIEFVGNAFMHSASERFFLLRYPAETSPDKAGLFLADRGHSLCSLYLPQAAVASLPVPYIEGGSNS